MTFKTTRRLVQTILVATLGASVAGCYVVPIDPRTGQPVPVPQSSQPGAAPSAPAPVTFPVRLYPANDAASRYGVVNATVTNDLHGRGVFNANINGESFTGEATRSAGSRRDGVANGAGNRGSYLACNYVLNSATQGTGTCKLSDGAVFNMHMGN